MIEKLLYMFYGAVITMTLMACAVLARTMPEQTQPASTPTSVADVALVDMFQVDTTEIDCLHKNIYWEARNQPIEGMVAVATVTLNRVKANGEFPGSICEVVYQAERDEEGKIILHRCQFSWYCDGLSDEPNLADKGEKKAWRTSRDVAEGVLLGKYKSDKLEGVATYYHADYVMPLWAATKVRVAKISSHIFYKDRTDKGAGAT